MKEQLPSGKKNKVNHCWTLALVRVLAIILAFNLQGVLLLMLQGTSSITNPLYGSNPLILIMVLYPGEKKKQLKTILPIRQLLFPAQLASSTCSMLGTPHFKCAPTNTEMLFCDLEPYPCGLKKTKVSKNRK